MSIKFTTPPEENNNNIKLLFEFLDLEAPESITIGQRTVLGKSDFIGCLQSNQINGIFLENIILNGIFYGTYARDDEKGGTEVINAFERSRELGRLQGRVLKFFFENITSYVIIENYDIKIKDNADIEYTLELRPHDYIEEKKPTGRTLLEERTLPLITTKIPSKEANIDFDQNALEEVINNDAISNQYNDLSYETYDILTERNKRSGREIAEENSKQLLQSQALQEGKMKSIVEIPKEKGVNYNDIDLNSNVLTEKLKESRTNGNQWNVYKGSGNKIQLEVVKKNADKIKVE